MVITLSLMVLLTLLAVGLLSLSVISLRTSTQGEAIAQARSNARMALIIALGQLQKAAGPDQRVTAPADLAGDLNGARLTSGKAPLNTKSIGTPSTANAPPVPNGLTSVQPGTRYWTGVWKTVTATRLPSKVYTETPCASDVQWLISGTELETSTTSSYTPSYNLMTVSANGTVSDPTRAVVLVGPGSVGSNSTAAIDNYVSSPLIQTTTPNRNGTNSRGRYGWWIGDEGVKARLNRTAASGQKATYPTLSSSRGGWEVVAGMQDYPIPSSPMHSSLEKVITLPTRELMDGISADSKNLVGLFHSATTDSFGVLADSLQSGLRIDLSSALNTAFPAANATTFPNAPKAGANIIPAIAFPASANSKLKGPKWDALKTYYTNAKTITTENKMMVKAGSGSGYEMTIAPIIVDLRVTIGVRMVSLGGTRCNLIPCGKIAVCLANPYPYPMEWDKDLEIELIDDTPTTNGLDTAIYGTNLSQRFVGRGSKSRNADGSTMSGYNEPAVFNNAVFVISKDKLAPGEAKAFTIGGKVTRPVNDTGVVKVPLRPFASASPSNFELCVELDQPTPGETDARFDFASAKLLDSRESWTTTQPTLEMRLAGGSSGTVLRRIERFEWDNGYHATTKNTVNANTLAERKMPFPLMVYTYQISQPGGKYDTQLPLPDMMGTRSSTMRTFTDFNLQASRFGKLITSYNPPPFYFFQTDDENELPITPATSSLPAQTGQSFTRDLAMSPVPWGRSMSSGDVKKTVLFTFPRQFTSLAQLQHVDLTADDDAVSVSQQPGNAVGNSYASPFVKRKQTVLKRNNYIITGLNTGPPGSATPLSANYYDMSYLLNSALWDTYFFSAMDNYGSPSYSRTSNSPITVAFPPANPSSLQDPLRAASHLLVAGSFNINSTNKDAWKALLAGTRYLEHTAGGENTSDAMFPRSLEQPTGSLTKPSGGGPDCFSGYRRLTPAQIDLVADEIVKQVRQRGPFVSLSHFINRTLIDINPRVPSSMMLGRSGALQAALDLHANISPDGTKSAFGPTLIVKDDKLQLQAEGDGPRCDMLTNGNPGNQPNPSPRGTEYGGTELDGSKVFAPSSADLNCGACASILADRAMLTDPQLVKEQGFRSTGMPGWITQADVLQAIGPVLSARSDTFRIRSYGEALGADGKTILAKAWCEAIVQRTPSYIDPTNPPDVRDATLTDKTLTATNKLFGRRFEIVSFRWLSSHEI